MAAEESVEVAAEAAVIEDGSAEEAEAAEAGGSDLLSILPSTAADFATMPFWDKFFTARPEVFEWYVEFDDLWPHLTSELEATADGGGGGGGTLGGVLHVGSGNSAIGAELAERGFSSLNIDFSETGLLACPGRLVGQGNKAAGGERGQG